MSASRTTVTVGDADAFVPAGEISLTSKKQKASNASVMTREKRKKMSMLRFLDRMVSPPEFVVTVYRIFAPLMTLKNLTFGRSHIIILK